MEVKQKIYVPIFHAYVYCKIRNKDGKNIIRTNKLNEAISRIFFRKGGFPKCFLRDILKEMEFFGLVKQLDHTKYKILTEHYNQCKNKTKKFLWFD